MAIGQIGPICLIGPRRAILEPMIVKLQKDMLRQQTVTCGEVDMILGTSDYDKLNVAVCPNIKPTIGHYHPEFDEIYFVLDGWIEVETYDPATDELRVVRRFGYEDFRNKLS